MTKKSENNKKDLPQVVIFGRTNVGKSTLFNCLLEKRQALVSKIPGTTRDSNLGSLNWLGFDLDLIDTGGIMDFDDQTLFNEKKMRRASDKIDEINIKVQKQAIGFLKKADLILFLVDNKTGLLPQDKQLANLLKKNLADKEKIVLVANKVDSQTQAPDAAEFNKLGLGEPLIISATTGSGTGDLLDFVIKFLKKHKKIKKAGKKEEKEKSISVCILGKPNVGKSSLLNKLLGWEKVIVSEIPHTTREPQDTEIAYLDRLITLIDTAGISRHGQKGKGLEKYGIRKSLKTLTKSNIVLLIIDINEDITHQDAKLVEEIIKRGKSFIIIANKWDLISEKNTKKYTQYIQGHFPFAVWAPILFVSALTGAKVKKIFDLILEIEKSREIKISDSRLNKFLVKIIKIHPPAKGKGIKKPRVYELKQVNINPPEFIVRIGAKEDLHASYLGFIKNKLREKYEIIGTPIKIDVVKNKQIHSKSH